MSLSPLNPLTLLERTAALAPSPSTAPATSPGGFERVINQLLGAVGNTEVAADQAVQSLVAGDVEDVHGVSLAVAQADLTLRLAVEIRNKLQSAYEEITRLQI